MKDFPFWREAITGAKTPEVLKEIGKNLAQFQAQTEMAGVDAEPKLTPPQVEALRKIYSERLKKLTMETLDVPRPKKSDF